MIFSCCGVLLASGVTLLHTGFCCGVGVLRGRDEDAELKGVLFIDTEGKVNAIRKMEVPRKA